MTFKLVSAYTLLSPGAPKKYDTTKSVLQKLNFIVKENG